MTKHYVAFTDNVLPVNGYASTDEGKIAKVVNDSGSYKLEVVDAGSASTTWSDVTGKPFTTIGTGLTVTNNALTADTQMRFQIYATLPPASAEYALIIALVLKGTSGTGNLYDEYACVNTSGSTWNWEKIGSTDFELTINQTTAGISINGTDLQSVTASQKGLLTSSDWSTFNAKQNAIGSANKLSAEYVDDTSTANKFVTASDKATWNAKQSAVPAGTAGNVLTNSGTDGTFGTSIGFDTAPTASSTNLMKSGAIKTALDDKVDFDSASTVVFKVGCDSTGPYVDY